MQLACDDVGSGECVVLIHGHPFDRTLWEPQLAALRDSFRVLAPDLRGFGHSPVVPGCVLMREYAADIEDLLDRLGITRAAVLGLSMGGLVAGQPMWADTHLGQRVGGAADIAKVTTANLVDEAVTWGIRRRAASAVVTETLDRVLAAIPATSGDERVLAAIRRQAERMSAASG